MKTFLTLSCPPGDNVLFVQSTEEARAGEIVTIDKGTELEEHFRIAAVDPDIDGGTLKGKPLYKRPALAITIPASKTHTAGAEVETAIDA
jgi:hypothetical protein